MLLISVPGLALDALETVRIEAVSAQARLFEGHFLRTMGADSAKPVEDDSWGNFYCTRAFVADQIAKGNSPLHFQEHSSHSYVLDSQGRRRIRFRIYPSADESPALLEGVANYSAAFPGDVPVNLFKWMRDAAGADAVRMHDHSFIGHPGYEHFLNVDGRFPIAVYRPWAERLRTFDRAIQAVQEYETAAANPR